MQKIPVFLAAAVLAVSAQVSVARAQEESPLPPGHQSGALRPPGPGEIDALKLSDQQKDQIRKINLATAGKTLPLRNELAEKEAHLRTLMTAREPDRAAIDRTADEVGNIRKDLFKAKIANDLKVNEVLTEEQKAMRDMRPEGPGGMIPPPGETGPGRH